MFKSGVPQVGGTFLQKKNTTFSKKYGILDNFYMLRMRCAQKHARFAKYLEKMSDFCVVHASSTQQPQKITVKLSKIFGQISHSYFKI